MIDKLVLRCDFKKSDLIRQNGEYMWPSFLLPELGVPTQAFRDGNGQEIDCCHRWESLPSSFEGMGFKIFDHRYDSLDKFYIELNASPAKIMQGHNIFGSSDFYDCCMTLIELLCFCYPQIFKYLDHESWSLAQIDITYSSRAKTKDEAILFIKALQNVCNGQTKSRTGYDSTAYFGKKNSRLKKIKVYLKEPEVLETIKKNISKVDGELLNEVYTDEILKFAVALIRWEVSFYHRYFERRGISIKLKDLFKLQVFRPVILQEFWQVALSDLFNSLKGQTMKNIKDSDIKQALRNKFSKVSKKTGRISTAAADAAFRTYRDIRRDGWELSRRSMVIRTFDHHIKMLTECGLSRAALQNMTGLNDGAEIIPFLRFIEVDFGAQFPEGYQLPAPKHVYERKPLSLVA